MSLDVEVSTGILSLGTSRDAGARRLQESGVRRIEGCDERLIQLGRHPLQREVLRRVVGSKSIRRLEASEHFEEHEGLVQREA